MARLMSPRRWLLVVLCSMSVGCIGSLNGDSPNEDLPKGGVQDGGVGSDADGFSLPDVTPKPDFSLPSLTEGATVAEFEVEVPQTSTFVLHGTVPIPDGVFPRADGKVPFAIKDSDDTLAVTQVDCVVWRPNDACRVAQVSAVVKSPTGSNSGDIANYKVTFSPFAGPANPGAQTAAAHLQALPGLSADVAQLVAFPDAVQLEAEDASGAVHRARLLHSVSSEKTLSFGAVKAEASTFTIMTTPSQSPGAGGCMPLPHLFGVHSYWMVDSVHDALVLTVKISNGASNNDASDTRDDPVADIYFKGLTVKVPAGWTVVPFIADPAWGTESTSGGFNAVDVLKPEANNKLHFIPRRGQYIRRWAIVKTANRAQAVAALNQEGWGFARPGKNAANESYYSWENPGTAAFMPSSQLAPSLDHLGPANVRSQFDAEYNKLKGIFESGQAASYPFTFPQLGFARTWEGHYGGTTGGANISTHQGAWVTSRKALLYTALELRARHDRQVTAIYNVDGEPNGPEHWVNSSGYIPWTIYESESKQPWGYDSADSCQSDYAVQQGLVPDYKDDLADYSPIDNQHHIRLGQFLFIMAWLNGDAAAIDAIKEQATNYRRGLHRYPYGNGTYWFSLIGDNVKAHAAPGFGTRMAGRGNWQTMTLAASYALRTDSTQDHLQDWAKLWVDTLHTAQPVCPWGRTTPQVVKNGKFSWTVNHGDNSYGAQHWESVIAGLAGLAVRAAFFEGVDATETTRIDEVIEGIGNGSAIYGWKPGAGPYFNMMMAPPDKSKIYCDQSEVPAIGFSPSTEMFYTTNGLAAFFRLTGKPIFRDRLFEAYGVTDMAGLRLALERAVDKATPGTVDSKAGALSLTQEYATTP